MTDTTNELSEMASASMRPQSTALVVVDMQEFFCRSGSDFQQFVAVFDPEGTDWYSNRVTDQVIPKIAALVDRARGAGVPVVFTRFGSGEPNGSDMPLWARRHNEMTRDLVGAPSYPPFDDPTSQVISELQPVPEEPVVTKVTSGPAVGTDIIGDLRSRSISTVVVTGVATNVCVMGMARELADADFDVLVVQDACAAIGEATHEAALASLATTFASVVSSSDVRFDIGAG